MNVANLMGYNSSLVDIYHSPQWWISG